MAYPTRLLSDDEELVLDMHPHWKRIVLPLLLVPVVVGAATFAVFALPDGDSTRIGGWAIAVVAALLLLWFTVRPVLRWLTTHYVVTTRRVVIREGVLSRSGRDIPLTRVNDVSFHHSLVDRMLRCGTLTVESAGERGQVVLPDVPHVEEVQRELYRLVEAEEARRRSDGDDDA
jgi:uncharacterized membrane protein YdbT with pleckstrin-like domain